MDSTVDPTYEVSLFALVMGCIFTFVGVIGNLLTIIALLRDLLRIWVLEIIHYNLVIFTLEVFVFLIFGVYETMYGPPSQFSV